MGTKFQEIYDMNTTIISDSRFTNKPTNLIYELFFSYLKYSLSIFQYDCYKQILDITPFSQVEFQFVANGIDTDFVLDIMPPNNLFYVSIDNAEITPDKYNYDSANNKIKFKFIPQQNSNIYISNYEIGYFNTAILNMREITILSEGMTIPYLEKFRNKNELLNQMVYGKDWKIFSQGQHIEQLNNSIETQKKYVQDLIIEYTYREASSLHGLGGGLYGDDINDN